MGNEASRRIKETPLAPQAAFPYVVNTRFLVDHVVTLRVQQGFWTHTHPQALQIKDVGTNKVMFQIPPSSRDPSLATQRQLLLDNKGIPVVMMSGYAVGYEYGMYVPCLPPRRREDYDEETPLNLNNALCFLETNNRPLEMRVRVRLQDPATGGVVNIKVEGIWRTHHALFWMDRGDPKKRECIGRAYLEPESAQPKIQDKRVMYWVDVAPGVDMALIILACAALDEELANKKSGKSIEIGTDETTRSLARRHHGMVYS